MIKHLLLQAQNAGLAIAILGLLYGCSGSSSEPTVLREQAEKPQLRLLDATVVEGAPHSETQLAFKLELTGDSGGRVTVSYSLHNIIATQDEDYRLPEHREVEFAPGVTSATIAVTIIGDAVVEGDETLSLRIDSVNPSINIETQEAIGTIVDDDTSYIHANNAGSDGSFTKLDAEGNPLPASAERWHCVQDTLTGLVWERKVEQPGPHHRLNRYSWYNTDPNKNGGSDGAATPAETGLCHRPEDLDEADCNTAELVRLTNAETLCGFTDWRLSTRFELRNLVDYSVTTPNPTIDSIYFPNTLNGRYWTTAPNTDDPRQAWNIDFWDGDSATDSKRNANYARLVRGPARWASSESSCQDGILPTAPGERFVAMENTVRDLYSGLIWQRCAAGLSGEQCDNGTRQLVSWPEAVALAENQRAVTGKGWRLPTIKELESLVELGCKSPAINETYFPNSPVRHYWTSTPGSNEANTAWFVSFFLGASYFLPQSELLAVRLVRSTY